MKLRIAWIGRTKSSPIQSLTAEYLKRLSHFAACEARELLSEGALLKLLERSAGRTQPVLVLLDSRGRQLTSEEIANFLEYHQSHDTQELLFAVGPADGWSDSTRSAAK
ncbi:MAG: 23S rRNA (pseudouridine(1915)-N(3))-methyltransferase RlmH, partial [Candidatus Korobacteraceae bacterium]